MKQNYDEFQSYDPSYMLMAHNSGPGSPRSAINQSRFQNFSTTLKFADANNMGIKKSRIYAFTILALHFITLDPEAYGFHVTPTPPEAARPKIIKTLFNGSRRPPGFEHYQLPEPEIQI